MLSRSVLAPCFSTGSASWFVPVVPLHGAARSRGLEVIVHATGFKLAAGDSLLAILTHRPILPLPVMAVVAFGLREVSRLRPQGRHTNK